MTTMYHGFIEFGLRAFSFSHHWEFALKDKIEKILEGKTNRIIYVFQTLFVELTFNCLWKIFNDSITN